MKSVALFKMFLAVEAFLLDITDFGFLTVTLELQNADGWHEIRGQGPVNYSTAYALDKVGVRVNPLV